jgi:ADP-ribose pyrophosphatase YjhB (NUDIX family)
MALTEDSRERVVDWVADFRERYDDFERVDERWELSPDEYESHRRRVEACANGGAGVWLTNDEGAVLLVRDVGAEGWTDPGGKREAGESFEAAARREAREETGVECRTTGLLELHALELVDETEPSRPTLYSCIAIFAGEPTADDPQPRPREGEIEAVEWFESPPERVGYPAVARRPFPASE